MHKIVTLFIIIFLIIPYVIHAEKIYSSKEDITNSETISPLTTIRQSLGKVVVIPESDPFFGIIGAGIACWYSTDTDTAGLLPLLVQKEGNLTFRQDLFLSQYLKGENNTLIILGEHLDTIYKTTEFFGSPPEVALAVATKIFTQASTVLIVPYTTDDAYRLSLIASPLAAYLNLPILFYDDNQEEIQEVCTILNSTNAFIVGDIQLTFANITVTQLEGEEAIQQAVLNSIKEQFGEINYITLTNPSDVILPNIISSYETILVDRIENVKVTLIGKEVDLIGNDTRRYTISIPGGINRVQISGTIKKIRWHVLGKMNFIDPIIYMSFSDPDGDIVAYSSSHCYDVGKTFGETLTCNAPGNYSLIISVYNGIKGGFFIQRGLSNVNTDIELVINISTLEKPHLPFIPKLSMTAPYLTMAHGGIILADPKFELTSDNYINVANGSGTGPWYNESLHSFNNEKVNYTIEQLQHTLSLIDDYEMLNNYLDGPAWLAILAGANMIPMYYYTPSQKGIPEKGLPSDNPYSLDWKLSVGRIVAYDVQDVSLLIARTLFYEDICGQPTKSRDWHNRFSFIFGEGFGETGGIFHQIPYSFEIRKYGFKPRVYGDLRNNRQLTMLLNVYSGANYIEYLGHGDWFWFSPSFYGIDYLSKAVDVAHAKNWIYSKPSIFLTSACLMARIDGIQPCMNIGITMLHAGCNCFVGATRETGQEAGLIIFENHLIVDNFSVGEALRGEKRVDKELPTYYVRVLYGDPAFNPYEPNNGFSNQGRPVLT